MISKWIKVTREMSISEMPPEKEWVEVTYQLKGQEPRLSVGYLDHPVERKGKKEHSWTIFIPEWGYTRNFYFDTVLYWRERVPAKCPKVSNQLK